jgi:uncharacterized protein (DUF58 family)
VASLFPGAWRARYHGRGLEFDEVRPYQWGDDFRAIDWRVTARTGTLHTRLYHEERERTLWLLCDAGESMWFGTRQRLKWIQAARAAALFAWLAQDEGDAVGALVHGNGQRVELLPASGGEMGLARLFDLLAETHLRPAGRHSSLGDAAARLRRLARPGALVLLLGDFSGLDRDAERHLSHLARHAELAAIRLFDPLEKELPPPGLYPVTGTEGCSGWLATGAARARRQWQARFERQQALLARRFSRLRARMLLLGTHHPLTQTLGAQLR